MKKLVLLAAMFSFVISGCITMHNSVPSDSTQVAMGIDVKSSYKILGPTEATAEGMVILGFIKLGDFDKVSVFPSSAAINSFIPISLPNPKISVECAASYIALDKYPEADRLLDPKWRTTVEDYFVFKKVTSTVKGDAVEIMHK